MNEKDKARLEYSGKMAFPAFVVDGETRVYQHGMTLRQWYAGKALPMVVKLWEAYGTENVACMNHAIVAKACFSLADAMIEHEKKEEQAR